MKSIACYSSTQCCFKCHYFFSFSLSVNKKFDFNIAILCLQFYKKIYHFHSYLRNDSRKSRINVSITSVSLVMNETSTSFTVFV